MFEFMCAQTPYKMRGLITGYTTFFFILSIALGVVIRRVIEVIYANDKNHLSIACMSTATCLSLIGLILHCILSSWYKMRVRDDQYCVQRVVEEVYDRYLSNAANSRSP